MKFLFKSTLNYTKIEFERISLSVTSYRDIHHRPELSSSTVFIPHHLPYVLSLSLSPLNSPCRFCYPSVKNDNAYFTKTCLEGRLRPTKTSACPKEVERRKSPSTLYLLPPLPLQHSQPKSHRSSPAPPAEAACSCQSSVSGAAPLIKKVNNEFGR